MDTINTIALTDPAVYPDEQVLHGVLGKSYNAYCRLLKLFDDHEMEYTWRYYKDGKAWLCKVQKEEDDRLDVGVEGIRESDDIFS